MMKLLTIALTLSIVSTASAATTFRCFAPRNNPEAFLAGGYARIALTDQTLRFQHYDTSSSRGRAVLLRDYVYGYKGINGGNGRTKGMMTFELRKEIKSYGDSIQKMYAQPSLSRGANGALMFSGHGYSWDWNFCKAE